MKYISALIVSMTFAAATFAAEEKSNPNSDDPSFDAQMAEAREELRKAAEKMKKLGMAHVGQFKFRPDQRGRLGVMVDGSLNANDGLHVSTVAPGSPADKAGIKAGDVLTSINGKSLVQQSGKDETGAYRTLVSEVRHAKKGDKVALEYRRGSSTARAEVTVEAGDRWFRDHKFKIFSSLSGLPESWSDLELVTLNPDLGQYFGAGEGVLVTSAPKTSELPLKAGDVIVKIGDRKPTTAGQAFRILGSYNEGESVTIEILRQRKAEIVSVKIPAHETKM